MVKNQGLEKFSFLNNNLTTWLTTYVSSTLDEEGNFLLTSDKVQTVMDSLTEMSEEGALGELERVYKKEQEIVIMAIFKALGADTT